MAVSQSVFYHVECSFFSWFTDAQEKDHLDDIHDEVSSIFLSANSTSFLSMLEVLQMS